MPKSKMEYSNTNLAYLADNIKSTEITGRTVFIVINIIRDFSAVAFIIGRNYKAYH